MHAPLASGGMHLICFDCSSFRARPFAGVDERHCSSYSCSVSSTLHFFMMVPLTSHRTQGIPPYPARQFTAVRPLAPTVDNSSFRENAVKSGHYVDMLALSCRIIGGFMQNQKRLHLKELGGWDGRWYGKVSSVQSPAF